jgi:hypothetical protein
MKKLTIMFFLLTFGKIFSQTSIWLDLGSSFKGSIARDDFKNWESGYDNISNEFDLKFTKLDFFVPLKFGIAGGLQFDRNEIGINYAADGSSLSEYISFPSYQSAANYTIPGTVSFRTSTSTTSFNLYFGRYLGKSKNFKVFLGGTLFRRAGKKGEVIKTGEFSNSANLSSTSIIDITYNHYTFDLKRSLGFNGGFDYKVKYKNKYLFTAGFTLKFDRSYLFYNIIRITTDKGGPNERMYTLNHYPTNSSINFTLCRRFNYNLKVEK